MLVKTLSDAPERSFAVVLDPGEEAVASLLTFARDYGVTAGRFTGLGAFSGVTLGFFDPDKKDYDRIEIHEQVEVVNLTGNFATQGAEARVHPHAVVSKRDGTAWGGHLLEGHVRPTLEVMVTIDPVRLQRHTDPETGLPLLNLASGGD
ncbi:PPC domain-containing DNA-binding protein [Tranquillimonas alkanivorans]|uniref:PPC domain-containing protein n=1 Tax=Tranquillimonas alkanivorans TaxID=441119 RepID=A0A1I5VM67_9RHOB|nr:PPC domain-containing DNA-binding protein [Tranquillimonas alkanivorans]SFQ08570.1 hypothetical protein SAMN04488047_13312 [Tranquillimonas alkanivorans]